MKENSEQSKTQSVCHYACVMAFPVVCALLVLTIGYIRYMPQGEGVQTQESSDQTATSTFARSEPVRLVIPKINLDTTFVPPLGLNADQTVSVPNSYEEVGWYTYGATPGEIGSAVILGHVDSVTGPAVFYSLGQLEVGDEIAVTRVDGTTATFAVTELRRYPQESFPTERVYGKTDDAQIRLVTCTGIYNRGENRYTHNLVVYGKLIVE